MVPEPFRTVAHITRLRNETMYLRGPDPRNHWNHPNRGYVCGPTACVCVHMWVRARTHIRVCEGVYRLVPMVPWFQARTSA